MISTEEIPSVSKVIDKVISVRTMKIVYLYGLDFKGDLKILRADLCLSGLDYPSPPRSW